MRKVNFTWNHSICRHIDMTQNLCDPKPIELLKPLISRNFFTHPIFQASFYRFHVIYFLPRTNYFGRFDSRSLNTLMKVHFLTFFQHLSALFVSLLITNYCWNREELESQTWMRHFIVFFRLYFCCLRNGDVECRVATDNSAAAKK